MKNSGKSGVIIEMRDLPKNLRWAIRMKDTREKAAKKHQYWLDDKSIRIDVQSRYQSGFDAGDEEILEITESNRSKLARY